MRTLILACLLSLGAFPAAAIAIVDAPRVVAASPSAQPQRAPRSPAASTATRSFEPAGWMMILAGAAALGGAMRLRSRKPQSVSA